MSEDVQHTQHTGDECDSEGAEDAEDRDGHVFATDNAAYRDTGTGLSQPTLLAGNAKGRASATGAPAALVTTETTPYRRYAPVNA